MITKKLNKIIEEDNEYLFQNYGSRLPVCFVRGEDSVLFDQDNNQYIDFLSGIAVSALGYGNRGFLKTIHSQIDSIIHTSNFFFNTQQIDAAKLISELAFKGKTLFLNSGTEANEAAIKLSRRYGLSQSRKKYQIITFTNSFHGRTFGSMSATAQKKIHGGFGPVLKGFTYLPFNDSEAFNKEIDSNDNTAAVMLELIQGEGGINIAEKEFVKNIAQRCAEKNILLVIDEVQTGIGRTGKPFAFMHYGIKPDIITLAKGLGGGIPVSALHAKAELAEYLPAGTHGCTFGGNHLATAATSAVLKEMKKDSIYKNISKAEKFIIERMKKLREKTSIINETRGMGLHIGIELSIPGGDIVRKALEKGLLINCTAGNVLRIMPPLNIKMSTLKAGMKILEDILLEEDNKK